MNLLRGILSTHSVAALSLAALLASASTASAFNPRIPPAVIGGGSLQGYLNGIGESINVNTDQLDGQVWTTAVSGNSTFTLMIELAGNAPNNAIGIYNAADPSSTPTLFQVFPGAATSGWHAAAHFSGGNLVVTLFDNNAVIQGQTFYGGVNSNGFGFYLSGPGGTFYSQDSRNAGLPYVLTFAGTGQNAGEWWECFEDLPAAGTDWDYEDAILLCQSIVPTPAQLKTWGGVKKLYK